jgi:ABC-type nickel/cobalt efflux system permease component RcnA
MRTPAAAVVALLTLAGSLCAHPVPSDNHDRSIVVRLTAEAVEVDYRLEMDETRAALDLPKEETATVSSRREFHEAVLRFHRTVLAGNLDARLDGKPLDFTCVDGSYSVTDHLRCDFRFRAAWHPAPGVLHTFAFREGNYELDDFSVLRLTIGAAGRATLLTFTAPDEKLMSRPGSERNPGDGERLRKASATFVVAEEEPRAVYKPALPPDPELPRSAPRDGLAARVRMASTQAAALAKPPPTPPDPEADDGHPQTLFHLLLDTRRGFAMLLLLAAGLGAAHALTPGHGKTLAAAYLVGERGTVGQAFALGLVTTVTHTAAVLLLAALLPVLVPNAARASVQAALELVGGLLVAGLGMWLLMVRLAGRADHVHLGGGGRHSHGGHSHSHGDGGHTHDVPNFRGGWRGLIVLGVSGGIVPCWDALAILAGTVSTQRMWLALPLLLAFSAGLASVLVAVGVTVVQAHKWAGSRWGTKDRFRRVERVLPLASAVVVTAMGLWLCYEAVHGTAARPDAPLTDQSEQVAPATVR